MTTTRALAERLALLEQAAAPGGELDPWGPRASTASGSPYQDAPGEATLDRAALHRRLAVNLEDEHPRAAPGGLAVIVAGPPGVGAGALAHSLLVQAGRNPGRFAWLDPADTTDRLARAHTELEGPSAPIGGDDVVPTPREAAVLLHNEAATLTGRLLSNAIGRRSNLVLRSTLADVAAGHELLGLLQERDYRVHLVVADAPRADALAAVRIRWARQHLAYEQGIATGADRLGGRFVPTSAVERMYDEHGRNLSALTVRELAETELVSSFRRYQVGGLTTGAPTHELVDVREGGADPIAPAQHEAMRVADLGTGLRPGLARRRPGRSRPATPHTDATSRSRRETGSDGPEL